MQKLEFTIKGQLEIEDVTTFRNEILDVVAKYNGFADFEYDIFNFPDDEKIREELKQIIENCADLLISEGQEIEFGNFELGDFSIKKINGYKQSAHSNMIDASWNEFYCQYELGVCCYKVTGHRIVFKRKNPEDFNFKNIVEKILNYFSLNACC
jgi:hypothetical protein